MKPQIKFAALPRVPWIPVGDRIRVITVRVPAMMHAQLIEQAHLAQTSLNSLCVSKLSAPGEFPILEPPGQLMHSDYHRELAAKLWPEPNAPPPAAEQVA